MRPGIIRDTNFTYKAPEGVEGCQDLHVLVGTDAITGLRVITSAWIPMPDEVERIKAGQPIWLHVYGAGHPVVAMSVPQD
jgi:hypothetical protein